MPPPRGYRMAFCNKASLHLHSLHLQHITAMTRRSIVLLPLLFYLLAFISAFLTGQLPVTQVRWDSLLFQPTPCHSG